MAGGGAGILSFEGELVLGESLNQTTVYRLTLAFTKQQLEKLYLYLTPEERARAERYLVDRPRQQFVGCRAALKFLLAGHLNCAVEDVKLEVERWGKPVLRQKTSRADNERWHTDAYQSLSTGSIHFSVSHSGDVGLIGLSTLPIGVDLEMLRPRISVASLNNIMLSELERENWKSISLRQHEEQMLRLWVCKEALLKALGLGIAECLQQVSFPLPLPACGVLAPCRIEPAIQIYLDEHANCSRNSWTSRDVWVVHMIDSINETVAAVATQDRQSILSLQDFGWTDVF